MKVYSIYSDELGSGPVASSIPELLENLRDHYEADVPNTIKIRVFKMSKKEYFNLPEFDGY